MNKEEIQKNIDTAVKVFRETLEGTYLKKGKEKAFYGVGVFRFIDMLNGNVSLQRKDDGSLRVSGCLSKHLFNEKCKGLPKDFDDWALFPMVLVLHNKDLEEKN